MKACAPFPLEGEGDLPKPIRELHSRHDIQATRSAV